MEPVFELVAARSLLVHEAIDPVHVEELARAIAAAGVVQEPIWVARGSDVILNGHHRYAALLRLGAERIPAWIIEYGAPEIRLDRWTPGPPITKEEVVARARAGHLFSIQTTRHTIAPALPSRPTPLALLGIRPRPTAARP
ncbi:MAG: ParB N-terminal domain-containing protein [Thermoplasmata archaeon]